MPHILRQRLEVMSVLSRPMIKLQGRSSSHDPSLHQQTCDPLVIAGFLVPVDYSLLG